MKSLGFPDVNVWVALMHADHVHHGAAVEWWASSPLEVIAFSRFTQMSVLRLLTTAATMGGKPLGMSAAWQAYDRLFEDDRVALFQEPLGVENALRHLTSGKSSAPKLWADAYLACFAEAHDGVVITLDRSLAKRAAGSVLLREHDTRHS